MEVKFYDNVEDKFLKFAVIISKYDNKWVFCKHKERDTYEIPGGHREENVRAGGLVLLRVLSQIFQIIPFYVSSL